MKSPRPFAFAGLAVALALPGCASLLPAPAPMAQVARAPAEAPRCVLVLLPGAGDHAEEFEARGFLALVEQRRLPVLAVAADATMGYYFRGTMQQRVTEDVVQPLRARHPEAELWLAGMSMGGFGSLSYAMEHPGQVSGVLAMAPYLGRRAISDEVRAAGGLRAWRAPSAEPTTEDNYQVQLWRWLKEATEPGAAAPSIYLGYGLEDSLAHEGAVLAAALPKERVWRTQGGHDWPYWRPIFESFLDSPGFRERCGPPAGSGR
jgi:pimeloyl-ACP methyl ester carboxylesterase